MSTEGRTAHTTGRESLSDPAYQAFPALRTVFAVAPIVFGLDLLVAALALARLATRYAPTRRSS